MVKLKPLTVEIWRDGESVRSINCHLIKSRKDSDGAIRLLIPVGTYVELTSEDELRFDPGELKRLCQLKKSAD